MSHSTVTSKGQTTIPAEVREALRIRPGGRLQCEVKGDHVLFRIHSGTKALKGTLASSRGKDLSF